MERKKGSKIDWIFPFLKLVPKKGFFFSPSFLVAFFWSQLKQQETIKGFKSIFYSLKVNFAIKYCLFLTISHLSDYNKFHFCVLWEHLMMTLMELDGTKKTTKKKLSYFCNTNIVVQSIWIGFYWKSNMYIVWKSYLKTVTSRFYW